MPIRSLNIHSLLHILLYFVFGYFFPNKWIYAIIISFLWEFLEYLLYYYFPKFTIFKEPLKNKIIDIIMNLIGFYLGYSFVKCYDFRFIFYNKLIEILHIFIFFIKSLRDMTVPSSA
jgi:hypothetical protein